MELVSSGSTPININGETGPCFKPWRGVRQGDPFSPLLFNLEMDILAAILEAAKAAGHLHGVVPHLIGGGGVSRIQYADYTILMVDGISLDIINLKFFLLCF